MAHLLAKLTGGATTADNASAALAAQRELAALVAKAVQAALKADSSWERTSAAERARVVKVCCAVRRDSP